MLLTTDRIYVAGHRGMVGSAIVRALLAANYSNIVTRSHAELDLTDQQAVRRFFASQRIDVVVLAAARVGGIYANNSRPAEFIYDNLMIEANVIHEAYRAGVRRLLFLGSSCIYPREAPQPMREEYLLGGALEPTNEPYAIAKIAGIKMCESYNRQYHTDFRSVMPTNLYGPHDNFDLESSHVLPALIRKFHLAKLAQAGDWETIGKDESRFGSLPADIHMKLRGISNGGTQVVLWGSGSPRREFLHVDDLAQACLFVMAMSESDYWICINARLSHLNVGTGSDLSIGELARLVCRVVGYHGRVVWDAGKPDGTPQKLLDINKLTRLGWRPTIDLEQGIADTYAWYLSANHQR